MALLVAVLIFHTNAHEITVACLFNNFASRSLICWLINQVEKVAIYNAIEKGIIVAIKHNKI